MLRRLVASLLPVVLATSAAGQATRAGAPAVMQAALLADLPPAHVELPAPVVATAEVVPPAPPRPARRPSTLHRGATRPAGAGADPEALLRRIMACESRGDPLADNPRSSASGLFQILDSTWALHADYARALHAPAEVQWEKARLLLARNGTQPWVASRKCWG